METILYRRKKVEIKTIPKGTVLFRIVANPDDDTRGYPLPDGTRCITPNQNVFFYPNPFVGKLTLGKWFSEMKTVVAYELVQDVKVLWLLSPSKNTRLLKNTRRNFLKPCSKVPKGCLPKARNAYDACVSSTIIKKYPEIVGMAEISINDARELKRNKTQRNRKYMRTTSDATGTKSVPELVLHPLSQRPQKDVIVHEGDVLENNYRTIGEYKLADEAALRSFMDTLKYNPDTFFYQR
jgi:hypothetical protein